MNNVLVTGGTGCIGSNLAAILSEQVQSVRVMHRAGPDPGTLEGVRATHAVGDITDPRAVHDAVKGCDTVFHTAALVSFRKNLRELQHHINVVGTRNVVRACLDEGVQVLVHTSSVAAIGYREDGSPADEDTPYNWGSSPGYRWSKLMAEREVQAGVGQGLNAVIVNPSVVVGERDVRFHGGQIIRDVKRGLVPFYVSGGMNVVNVTDVAIGMIAAALRGRRGERYILGGENLTHKEIFSKTAMLVGGRQPMAKLPLPILRATTMALESVSSILKFTPLITRDLIAAAGKNVWFSLGKARRELGYSYTPFEQAVRAAHRWYVEHHLL